MLKRPSHPLNSETFARFDWIRDLRDYGGNRARMSARALILRWLSDYKNWSVVQWPDLIAIRLTNLSLTYGWFGQSADEDFQTVFETDDDSAVPLPEPRLATARSPFDQLVALSGLVMSQVAKYCHCRVRRVNGYYCLLDLIVSKAKDQLNPDGGHRSRRPETRLWRYFVMLECRVAIALTGIARPDLAEITLKMATVTKCGGWHRRCSISWLRQHPSEDIEQVITRCAVKGRVTSVAQDTGFVRLSAARSLVIMDTVSRPARTERWVSELHPPASLFAFEFSVFQPSVHSEFRPDQPEPRLNRACVRQLP